MVHAEFCEGQHGSGGSGRPEHQQGGQHYSHRASSMLWGRRGPTPAAANTTERSNLQWWAPPLPCPRLPVAHGAGHRLVS